MDERYVKVRAKEFDRAMALVTEVGELRRMMDEMSRLAEPVPDDPWYRFFSTCKTFLDEAASDAMSRPSK